MFDGPDESLKTPSPLPWLDGVALRDLVLHETHAACVDARGDVYQWGSVSTQGSLAPRPVRTLRGKVSVRTFCRQMTGSPQLLSIQNIKQLSINGDKLVALSQTGHVFLLSVTNVQPAASSSSFRFWDAGDKGGAVELTPQHALARGEKSVLLPLQILELY